MRYLFQPDDEGGPAGDTGSAMHKAAESYHKGAAPAQALQIMQDNLADYPKADLVDAANLFLRYATDPRNRDAEIVEIERAIRFEIAPAEEDPTQAPIQVVGTLDQVRRVDGRFALWDIKTSKKEGTILLNQHTFQQAAYCVGASVLLKAPVHPGGLILPRKYRNDGSGPVFWHYPWAFEDLEHILQPLRHQVAAIRVGRIYHSPNDGCMWCPAKSPDLCYPALKEYRSK